MTGFNHGLVGGLIARYMPLPLALPLAFVSHFVLDALPHYGIPQKQRDTSKLWKRFFTIDAFATFGLAVYAVLDHHYAMFFGGLAAVIPDFLWVARVIKTRSFNMSRNGNWFTKWHAGIQKFERPWGIWIELPLAVVLFYTVVIINW